jgi:hypothetical protein
VYLTTKTTILAQDFKDINVIGQMQSNWSHFVQTGQIWALLIGICVGYALRSLTSFG